MIKKYRETPVKILKFEALLRRLHSNHPIRPRIEEDLAKRVAGYRGQKAIDYYLCLLDDKQYLLFHDIRLHFKDNYYFQIDTLIVTDKFIIIAEVKNISGELYYDYGHQQLIRTYNEKVEVFEDPVLQAERQRLQFKLWMEKNKLPPIPIETLVVHTNSSSILKFAPPYQELLQNVIRSPKLPFQIQSFESNYKNVCLNNAELRKLTRQLISQHTYENPDVLKQFGISQSELQTGVQCPACRAFTLIRQHGSWYCSNCVKTHKNAHILALKDYALLMDSTINNRELRRFLHINSSSVATKLLTSLNLDHYGQLKNRTYILPGPHEWKSLDKV